MRHCHYSLTKICSRRDCEISGRCEASALMEKAVERAYGPNPTPREPQGVVRTLTEADVRRIVREEVAQARAEEREACAQIVRDAAKHGLCCSDSEALADLVSAWKGSE